MTLPLILAALLAPAQATETPRAFATRLYAAYRNPDYSPFSRPERVFAPPFVAALRESFRLSEGEVGFLDADPLCQCQDPAGLKAEVAAVRALGASAAEVRVLVRFGGADVRDVRLKLVRTPGGWRVADLATPDEASFLGDLRAWNRRQARIKGRSPKRRG